MKLLYLILIPVLVFISLGTLKAEEGSKQESDVPGGTLEPTHWICQEDVALFQAPDSDSEIIAETGPGRFVVINQRAGEWALATVLPWRPGSGGDARGFLKVVDLCPLDPKAGAGEQGRLLDALTADPARWGGFLDPPRDEIARLKKFVDLYPQGASTPRALMRINDDVWYMLTSGAVPLREIVPLYLTAKWALAVLVQRFPDTPEGRKALPLLKR